MNVADLPEEWNDRFEAFFGITPPTDTLGVLQDVHWSSGLIGYFPTYALGNLLAAQYFSKALKATVPASPTKSPAASSTPCSAGCARTSTSTGASSPPKN